MSTRCIEIVYWEVIVSLASSYTDHKFTLLFVSNIVCLNVCFRESPKVKFA